MQCKHIVVIVLLLLISVQCTGLAEASVPDADLVITTARIVIEKVSGNSVKATATVIANMSVDSIGVKSFVIQENDGSGWEPVKGPVTDLKVSARGNTVTLSFTGTPGYRYRAKGTLYAAKSSYPTYSEAKTSGTVTR